MKPPKPPITIDKQNIKHIDYSGLKGRIIHYESKSKKSKETFVLIAGVHSSHERMASFGEYFARYGDVYMVDVPGFGGMSSLEEIGKEITLDNFAEYVYTILKTQKFGDNVNILGISFGFTITARMLQMYPQAEGMMKRMIGLVAFGSGKDFNIGPVYKTYINGLVGVGGTNLGSAFFRIFVFNRYVLRFGMRLFALFKPKMMSDDPEMQKKLIQMECNLWAINDVKTHARAMRIMFDSDLTSMSDRQIEVPAYLNDAKTDQYFDLDQIKDTMSKLFKKTKHYELGLHAHMPSLVADDTMMETVVSSKLLKEIMSGKEPK